MKICLSPVFSFRTSLFSFSGKSEFLTDFYQPCPELSGCFFCFKTKEGLKMNLFMYFSLDRKVPKDQDCSSVIWNLVRSGEIKELVSSFLKQLLFLYPSLLSFSRRWRFWCLFFKTINNCFVLINIYCICLQIQRHCKLPKTFLSYK